jgi:hypothetical protein
MAVEMAKLSLWLISMDAERSFTFVDDRLRCGDSLLGLTSLDQLEAVHLDPAEGRRLHEDLFDWTGRVRPTLAEVADLRRRIAEVSDGEDEDAMVGRKRELLADSERRTMALSLVGDLVIGAALIGVARTAGSQDLATRAEGRADREHQAEARSRRAAELTDRLMRNEGWEEAREQAACWLDVDLPAGAIPRQPLHWPLVFPEVFDLGGFDAVIGNPPFLGGLKFGEVVGALYKELLVRYIGQGVRGNRGTADLVAYFVLRAMSLVSPRGQAGLIATNTLAQGDTRSVGLDQVLRDGASIRRAVRSAPWPSRSAVLEYCAVWISVAPLDDDVIRVLDGERVPVIGASLEVGGAETPHKLRSMKGLCLQGSNILGLGFIVETEEAGILLEKDPRNVEVLFPYMRGQDLSIRPDCSPSRWVINFHDWPESRAAMYPDCFAQVERLVRPERQANMVRSRRERWWQYSEYRRGLAEVLAGLDSVIVLTRVSKTVMPVLVATGPVFNEKVVVFASDDPAVLAVLSSGPHYWWARRYSSTLKSDLNYVPSDVVETLVMPELTEELRRWGTELDAIRREIMLRRKLGLTKLYNEVFDPTADDADVRKLRRIHQLIDEATIRAYGWDDLLDRGLDHGFHLAGRGTRYTVGPAVQTEILHRLLELNHQRHAEEVAAGLHETKVARGKGGGRVRAKAADPTATLAETKGEEHLF